MAILSLTDATKVKAHSGMAYGDIGGYADDDAFVVALADMIQKASVRILAWLCRTALTSDQLDGTDTVGDWDDYLTAAQVFQMEVALEDACNRMVTDRLMLMVQQKQGLVLTEADMSIPAPSDDDELTPKVKALLRPYRALQVGTVTP